MTRKRLQEISEVYRGRPRPSITRHSRISRSRTLHNPRYRPSETPIMRVYNDSVFGPNSSYTSSVTRDTVDAFDTTPRIPSPSPPIKAMRKTASNFKASRAWQPNSSAYKARVSNLEAHGRRVMQYYAGNTPEAQLRTLEKLEQYESSHKQSPIAPIGKGGPRGGESQLKWECMICNVIFPTFQKAAVHLTSREWCLPNWRCPELLCARIYQSRNELNRHEKSHFKAGHKKSLAASGRSSQGSVISTRQSGKDEKLFPPASSIQAVGNPAINPSIQINSLQETSTIPTTTFLDSNHLGYPSQDLQQYSCDSEISDSPHLVGSHYLPTEPPLSQTLVQSSDFDWLAPSQLENASFMRETGPLPLIIGPLTPDYLSMRRLYSNPNPSEIPAHHQSSSIDIYRPAPTYQCHSPQPGDILQPPFVFASNSPTDLSTTLAYRTHCSTQAGDTLAEPILTQDVTRNHDLRHDWSHHGSDLGAVVPYQQTGYNLEQTSTHINRSLNDSHYRLAPNRYHDYPTQFITGTLEMVRLRPCPCFPHPIMSGGWEGGIMPARVWVSINVLIGYQPMQEMVDRTRKFTDLAWDLCVVLVLESLYELYQYLGNQCGFETHIIQQRN